MNYEIFSGYTIHFSIVNESLISDIDKIVNSVRAENYKINAFYVNEEVFIYVSGCSESFVKSICRFIEYINK